MTSLRLVLALAGLGGLLAVAADPKPGRVAISDPTKLKDNTDFALQGEYSGGKQNDSLQVIALGDGKFRGKAFDGKLPGEGPAKQASLELEGTLADGAVVFKKGDRVLGTLKGGEVRSPVGDDVPLKKVLRESPTIGAKPPEGADVLFGGTGDEEKWAGGKLVKLSDGQFLAAGCTSKKTYGDFTAHVEFRLPFMPNSRGQARGNSGVYPQDRYEIQVLDSFGLKGENNECGGVYTVAKPSVNMCFPPMAWQTYDIDFTAAKFDEAGKKTANARLTLKHNGVTVHDNIEIPKSTGGGQPEGPKPGPIQLQNHGDPVVYRNIWAKAK
jgi:hypothetical protein